MLHHWFIVERLLGLHWALAPLRRPRKRLPLRSSIQSTTFKTPPAPNYYKFCLIIFVYILLICSHVHAVFHEVFLIYSLCAAPTILLRGSLIMLFQRHNENRAIHKLLNPPCNPSSNVISDHIHFNTTSCDTKKLTMLSAWQTSHDNSTIMDYLPGSKAICIDTGASASISNDKRDFITFNSITNQTTSGIGSGLNVEGCGTILWTITDDEGNKIKLYISDSFFVPNIPICLLCPQQVAKQTNNPSDGFTAGGSFGTLQYDGFVHTIHYNGRNGLPLIFATQATSGSQPSTCNNLHAAAYLSTTDLDAQHTNITKTQRKLLHVHKRMAHLGLDEV
jgi:hypothetical protein